MDKPHIDLNARKFKSLSNSENGEVGADTVFHYRQKENIVWATYEGGDVLFGTLSGRIIEDKLEYTYQHQNLKGEFMTGKCNATARVTDGKIRITEEWQWTCKDYSRGSSIIEELID